MEEDFQYNRVRDKANEIEAELKRMHRWQEIVLPEEKFDNMGAFGCNTMTFEQWLQFVLLWSIKDIIANHGSFPTESNVAAYAVRVLDGDVEAAYLVQLLQELDDLITVNEPPEIDPNNYNPYHPILASSSDLPVPEVLYQLAEILHTFDGDDLEAQLQTFDTFLTTVDLSGRKAITQMLFSASDAATPAKKRLRLRKAALAVSNGGTAATPYNHEDAMKKYQEEFKKSYPADGEI